MFLFGGGKILGLDIGTTSVKIAEVYLKDGRYHLGGYGILVNYGYLERVNDAIQTRSFKIAEENAAYLINNLIEKAKVKVKTSIVSVPNFNSFSTLLDFPIISDKEIAKAIPFQAKQYIPIPTTELVLDWQVVEELTGHLQILLMAVPKDIINRYIKISKLSKLKIRAIELEAISLARCLLSKDPTPSVILDIGGRNSSIIVVDKGTVRMISSFDSAGGDLTQVIAAALNVNPFRAEEIKKTYGLKPPPGQEVIANLMSPLLDNIKSEVDRVIFAYKRKTNRDINQIIITGGSANLVGLIDYYQKQSKIRVIKGDPFELGVIGYDPKLAPVIKDIGSSLAVACGLAMRGL